MRNECGGRISSTILSPCKLSKKKRLSSANSSPKNLTSEPSRFHENPGGTADFESWNRLGFRAYLGSSTGPGMWLPSALKRDIARLRLGGMCCFLTSHFVLIHLLCSLVTSRVVAQATKTNVRQHNHRQFSQIHASPAGHGTPSFLSFRRRVGVVVSSPLSYSGHHCVQVIDTPSSSALATQGTGRQGDMSAT